jgi:hypothetical protein
MFAWYIKALRMRIFIMEMVESSKSVRSVKSVKSCESMESCVSHEPSKSPDHTNHVEQDANVPLPLPSRAVYVGAGHDIRPIKALDSCKQFVYIDVCASDTFVNSFDRKMSRIGFYVSEFQPDQCNCICLCFLCRFKSKKIRKQVYTRESDACELVYYFGVSYPAVNDEIAECIKACNTIIFAGFDPVGSLLDAVQQPCNIICFQDSNYCDCSMHMSPGGLLARLYQQDAREIILYTKVYEYTMCSGMSDVCRQLEQS